MNADKVKELIKLLDSRMYVHWTGYEQVLQVEINPEMEELIEDIKAELENKGI